MLRMACIMCYNIKNTAIHQFNFNDLKEDTIMSYSDLKKYFDSKNSTMSFDFRVRIHRALSWGQAAEKEERLDEKLIKYWISFNALYGSGFTEFSEVEKFLGIVISVDKDNILKNALIEKTNTIKNFFSIPELYDAYWKDEMATRVDREKVASKYSEKNKDKFIEFIKTGVGADAVLFDLFDLIYLLRNQIFHGSASYDSVDNNSIKENCIEILGIFIPLIIEIMINNPNNNWHEVKYKPIRNEKFVPQTKEEKEIALKMNGWLNKVNSDGECKTPPLSKESRRIVYRILESKGIYTSEKYYPSDGTEGLIFRKK